MELNISHLTKEFKGVAAVDDVSYTLGAGVYGLLGVNGAGKTTLMRMLCTLMKPDKGCITWDGKDIFELDGQYRKLLGYLPQDFGYYPDFTVQDYLMYVGSIKGLRPATAKQRTARLIKQVGLEKEKKKKMKRLSGGMKRRVGIPQAVLNNPSILILDEPTAGLDPNERIRFRNLISELAQERLVLLSTHIVSDVEYIANEILLMKDGKICVAGTPKELLGPMRGQVWSMDVSKKEAGACRRAYKVANVRTTPEGINLRILSAQRPSENALPQEPVLEDVFLHYFGEGTVEEDASI